jgi:hypothetical protein
MANELVCKSKSAALCVLNTMADNMPGGTQRDALIAVKNWMADNIPADYDSETLKKLAAVFEGTEEQKRGRVWLEHEMSDPSYEGSKEGSLHHRHHKMIHEPEDGAELDCFWNAKYKAWEPIGYGWPNAVHTHAQSDDEE